MEIIIDFILNLLYHALAIPRTDVQSRANVCASTLSGIEFCCSISWNQNSELARVLSASLQASFPMNPSFLRSKRVNTLLISSLLKMPVLNPYSFLSFNCWMINPSMSSGHLKQIAVQISSNNSTILCFLRYSSARSLRQFAQLIFDC